MELLIQKNYITIWRNVHLQQGSKLLNCTFIVDNVPFHKNKEVAQLIMRKDHELKFLPHTPEFILIDNKFSIYKYFVRKTILKILTNSIN